MKYIINKDERPIYLQLYKQVRNDIVTGNYPYNTKLPSKRTLADETGVSTITVEHAYALLCDEGYVESKQRSGYIVIFRTNDAFSSAPDRQTTSETSAIAHTKPDFPLSVLSKTMRKVLSERGDTLLEKSPNRGCDELREAIRLYLARNRGIDVGRDQIIIGSGSEYLYGLIVKLLGRHRTYAIESPSYKKIEEVYKTTEITYEPLALTSSGIDSKALENTSADVLHTTPYRSYPSGVTASATKRHEYIRWATKHNGYIIEDDFESEFSFSTQPTETLFSLSECDNVIYMNSFSKTISPSLRIGYMVLPKHLTKDFEEKLGFYSSTVSTFMQYVLAELINNGDFERHIRRVRRKLQKQKEI